jgi:hypothetical protein
VTGSAAAARSPDVAVRRIAILVGEPAAVPVVRALVDDLVGGPTGGANTGATGGDALTVLAPAAARAALRLPEAVGFQPLPVVSKSDAWTEVVTVSVLRGVLSGPARPDLVHAFGVRAGFVAALASRTVPGHARPSLVVSWPPDPASAGALRGLERRLVARAATVSVVGDLTEATPLFGWGGRDVRALPAVGAAATDHLAAVRALYDELVPPTRG